MSFVFGNNIKTTLSAAITSGSQTSIQVASTTGWPSLSAGQVLALTLNDAATQSVFEIVYVTNIAGTTLTVVRAQEGTTGLTWLVNDIAFGGITVGILSTFGVSGGSSSQNFAAQNVTASGNVGASGTVTAGGAITSGAGVVANGAITAATTIGASGLITCDGLDATTGPIQGSSNGATVAYAPIVYTSAGAVTASSEHIVRGTAGLVYASATLSFATINLSGAAEFSSSSSYYVEFGQTNSFASGVTETWVQYNSGSQFLLWVAFASNQTGTLPVAWMASGY